MRVAERLTDALVRRASAGENPQLFFWDAEVKGFALRITKKGAKSFVLDYRLGGRQRRMTIGSYPDWSVQAARKEACSLKRLVDKGKDPMDKRHADRTAPTVDDLWRRYQQNHLPRKAERSQVDERIMWKKLILPEIGKHKVTEISHDQVECLHRKITNERGTPIRANRTIEVLRKAFNLAIRWEWCVSNPASGIQKNREEKRERFLSPEELARLSDALATHSEPVSANAILLLMLTGARKSEVLNATWRMFDLHKGVWIKPSGYTKQRREQRVPLSAAALTLLQRMKATPGSVYVFPGKVANQPLTDIKHSWASVCIMAGLAVQVEKRNRYGKVINDKEGRSIMTWKPDVRLHDLRHSFASLLVSGGASLPIIGAMLGHTQVQTTQRYAHLYDEPLRQAANHVGNAIDAAVAANAKTE
jgi:integrase